ncbi:MAG: GHMP family kinase ATP-binding protein [Promethearchaeota archaeon]
MLQQILDFIKGLNPDILIQAPARINLINPLDAVEGDFWMPSAAINGLYNPLSVFVYIKRRELFSSVKFYSNLDDTGKLKICVSKEEKIEKDLNAKMKKLKGEYKLFYASVYRLIKTNSAFREKFEEENFEIGIITTIPLKSGLGGSAAIIIGIMYGLAKYFGLYNNFNCLKTGEFPINRDILAEIATKVEDQDLKITAGYGDRYVIARGGLGFCSYFGKIFHKKVSLEPLAIYDRIDLTYKIKSLPIIICFSGVAHESGAVHEKLRRYYLDGDPTIVDGYQYLAEISWKSRFALMKHDWKQLGDYFKENTAIMNNLMRHVGFLDGIGSFNNILIRLIEHNSDVFAAKLTGAGGGGSIFALVKPDKIDAVLSSWKEELNKIITNEEYYLSLFPECPLVDRDQLKNAQFFKVKIVPGVKKL